MASSNTAGVFGFISNSLLRKIIEVLVSSIPGSIVFFIFIVATGILNIFSSSGGESNIFTLTYIPVVCVLPIVIGVIGPLILEKIRANQNLSLRASVLVSFLSSLAGSFFGAFALVLTGLVGEGFNPFGGLLDPIIGGAPGLLIAMVLIVFISTILSTIGGALITVLLNRAGN